MAAIKQLRTLLILIPIALFCASPLFSQESALEGSPEESLLDFGLGLGMGSEIFQEQIPGTDTLLPTAYNTLRLTPDLNFGEFGIGIDLTVHYRFTENGFDFRTEDWVPYSDDNPTAEVMFQRILDMYLPIIRYVRWGQKGSPLFVKAGFIDNGHVGNGYILSGYRNTLFQPEKKIIGFQFDLDGALFEFPYVGFESFIGNIARMDLIAGRLYVRPLSFLEIPVIQHLQVGATFGIDREPDALHSFSSTQEPYAVMMGGIDLVQPIIANDVVSLAAYADMVVQPGIIELNHEPALGGMVGLGGNLFGMMTYGFRIYINGENFIPVYFDAEYDAFREDKYRYYSREAGLEPIPQSMGYMGSIGGTFFDDMLWFQISMDGTFASLEDMTKLQKPHGRAVFALEEGLVPDTSFRLTYDKRYIDFTGAEYADWKEVLFLDAVIEAALTYSLGIVDLTLAYSLRYNPDRLAAGEEEPWENTAKLLSTINLF